MSEHGWKCDIILWIIFPDYVIIEITKGECVPGKDDLT